VSRPSRLTGPGGRLRFKRNGELKLFQEAVVELAGAGSRLLGFVALGLLKRRHCRVGRSLGIRGLGAESHPGERALA